MSIINQLKNAAKKAGLKVVEVSRNNDHYQITGGNFLVNYYPHSKNQTAYVSGTNKGKKGITPRQAVALAIAVPGKMAEKVKRRNVNGQRKKRLKQKLMVKQNGVCCWDKYGGGCKLSGTLMIYDPPYTGEDSATIEHVIPLGRGGLDNNNNIKLAHKLCNQSRENDMPEVE